ncbi:UDP-N-acetylmuramoyl-L-alanyl-D-glutamate--2,6-diaminopimelate ligase [Hathewaya limosa]|uniref:UDP-N-acetylmuramoyl-L-alanyl-D-glutamate--2,6-diaminopimelate ligase n=1 Tax=Hathewaya limosa TaxID=1536 RepID=A0ABU0JXA5_HATLI|nr:UDP-N-acetylmuramoyl-L-alanyl-D-glutamate--2,6-diaminopimelate ligase [Hathewaya limosa]MDQ0480881.1 UDP-N-acetylmuramoyl-L-alanyl-D-glutamate--2,6-diaminopimelate ligase [Hathewaya limosa]
MNLKKILNNVEYEVLQGSLEVNVNKICYDNRKIQKGDMFVALVGTKVDGHNFIKDAIEKGAESIIVTKDIELESKDVTIIKVKDGRKTLAICSANYYNNPSNNLKVIGITGTNGKTTSTFMLKRILEEQGYKVGLVGTIANYIGNKKLHSDHTTPESLELHKLFRDMVDEGVQYCIMEVSSHSLALDRVYGVSFEYGIFTNLTRDHLDFHKTFEAYFDAKFKLFENSKVAIVNIDDTYGKDVVERLKNTDVKVITYGFEEKCTFRAFDEKIHARGVEFKVSHNGIEESLYCALPGRYNISNSLSSMAVAYNENVSMENIKNALKVVAVPGRCEILTHNKNLGFEIIVDYAHTPDGLDNILKTAREFTKGRLISVFGCGGDRDKTKRPIMGKVGTEISDIAIVTSDNPRTEEPMAIIKDVLEGIEKDNYMVVENRREAIKKAIELGKKDDVIVIAGKGHEDYQILKEGKIHFDEREVVDEILKEMF